MNSTKLNVTFLTIIVAVVNAIAVALFGKPIFTAGTNVGDVTTLAVQALNFLVEMMPTIVTWLSTRTYVNAKTKQNIATIEAGTPTIEIAKAKAEAEVKLIEAQAKAAEVAVPAPSWKPIKERIRVGLALVSGSTLGALQYIEGSIGDAIQKSLERMLQLNPNLTTIEAVQELVWKYFDVKLSTQDCAIVNSIPGLFPAMAAQMTKRIMESFIEAYQTGKLKDSDVVILTFKIAARQRVVQDLMNEMNRRMLDGNLEQREQVLREYEFTEDAIKVTDWEETNVYVYPDAKWGDPGSRRLFNLYLDAGIDSNTMLPIA